ncbi:tyrosine-type recombinase/integrase [Paenibacillus sp. LjRoot56]|uniref:tyrosine-type recombinase/integrase n=1 Tax=Paenibacillus sp. LjRoot56 TaxID=3342333 RepID=UPI003ECD06BF
MLLEDIFKEFLFDLDIKNYSVRTKKGYKNNNLAVLNFLKNEFNINEIEEVSTSHIKAYLMNLKKKGLSETYINGIQKNIRSFIRFCIEEGYIAEKKSPVIGLKWLKEPKILIQTFEDDEVKKMISVYKGDYYLELRNKLILMCFVDLGIRNLELCSLTCLDVRESVIKINGKGNKERNLYISPYLKKYMIKYERMKEMYFKDKMLTDSNYFLSQNGKVLTNGAVEIVVKRAGVEAKVRKHIRCSPHTLRHYYAQKQLRLGLDIYSLSRLLGHESTLITNRYLQSINDDKIIELARTTSPLMNL